MHRDAFLYFAMGDHLRLWRMDFPPLIAILANVQTAIFGHTLAAARIFPMLEGAALLVLAALIARELGGGPFAQGLAALPMLCEGVFLRSANLFQPVVLDQLWWTLSLYALLRVGRAAAEENAREGRRWWLAFGAAAGLGLLTKFSILFIGLAVLGALLVTPLRRSLRTPWPWAAAAIAFALGSPSVVGQIRLGFPVVGQMHDLVGSQLTHVTYASFVLAQPLMVGASGFLLAVAGAAALIGWRPLAPYRAAGWACVLVFVLLMALHGKAYYVAPIYPTLIAAGAVWLDGARLARWPSVPRVFRWGLVALMLAEGAVGLPITLPILSPPRTAVYIARAGLEVANATNWGGVDLIPQDFADMLGWRRQSAVVARVYRSLAPAERAEAVLGADNYGEAGALEFWGRRYGLPYVVCGCGSYWFFGPGSRPGRVLIDVGTDSAKLAALYGDVRRAARILSPWSVREERDVPVWIARQPRMTLQQAWPKIDHGN
ncbi:MAG: glycosyltransferase family 39 protein [Gemmatimonadota bacterium]|nr:glycosyltransferase family 39 protein [Gemmatimonadota bacterium]